jgi:putative ABC transport system substrate-binding protein
VKRRIFVVLVLLIGAMLSVFARADQPAVPRIGALVLPRSNGAFETGLREGLRDLGYIEGKSIIIEWRRAEGKENDV